MSFLLSALRLSRLFRAHLMLTFAANVDERAQKVGDRQEKSDEVDEAEIDSAIAADLQVERAGVASDGESHQNNDHANNILDRQSEAKPVDA